MAINLLSETQAAEKDGALARYEIDPVHTMVEFSAKHLGFSTVKGRFLKSGGEIDLDEANPSQSSVDAWAEVASVNTGDEKRDAHVRSADFFDAENHPRLTFRSRRVEASKKGGEYHITGDLTMRGVTHEVTFVAEFVGKGGDPWGGQRIGLTATATVNRKDYGLQWNVALEAGGWLVGDAVKINLEVQAVKKG